MARWDGVTEGVLGGSIVSALVRGTAERMISQHYREKRLHAQLLQGNARHQVLDRVPTLEQVTDWITQAQRVTA